MLIWLAHCLMPYCHGLRIFDYLTIRAIFTALTALLFALFAGPAVIRLLQRNQMSQPIRHNGPQSHLEKQGTPTMGGILIVLSITMSILLWGDLSNRYLWAVCLVMICFACIGGVDDYLKLCRNNSRGISAKLKFSLQSAVALTVMLYLYSTSIHLSQTQLVIPFYKQAMIQLGAWYVVLGYFVVVGSSNAVNLTDGLDGLAILPTVLVGSALGIIAYLAGNIQFAHYLHIPYIPGAGELVVYCGALGGAGLGFLWFNTYPAQIFMGDVGALALGAALGVVALITRHEIVFFIMSGIFVIETVSVILQVASFKLTGKRIFMMAPLHHHYELKGWPEPRVIVRFWIITVMLVLFGLATLKLR